MIDWRWFGQTLNPYYEHDQSTSTMLIDDDRLIFHTIDDDRWDFGADNSGNLIDQRNIEHYISRFQPMKIDLVRGKKTRDVVSNFIVSFIIVDLDHSRWKFRYVE